MNAPPKTDDAPAPWLFIIGLALGVSLLAYMAWNSFRGSHGSRSANVVALTEQNWQKEVVESKTPVLVDFTAEWCPPCRELAPKIDMLADRYQGKIKVAMFDVGDKSFHKARDIADKYGIHSIPCVLVFAGGDQPRRRLNPPKSEADLVNAIEEVLR